MAPKLQVLCNHYSTYGVSGSKWHYAARAAVQTMLGSFGGGCVGLGYSMFLREGRLDIMDLINSILGSLVSVTGTCLTYKNIYFHELCNIVYVYTGQRKETLKSMRNLSHSLL